MTKVPNTKAARATSSSQKILRRKKADGNPTAVEHAADKDPAALAALVAETWGASIQAIIKTGILLAESLRAFTADPDRLDAFIIELVKRGVLTEHEARRRYVAPKLVKLRTIGEHEKLLTLPRISPFLVPSYTTLYHMTVVYRWLPETDEQQRIAHLVRILEGAPDEITRDFLIGETGRLKDARRAASAMGSARGEVSADADIAPHVQPQLVLMTPDEADERAIVTPYAPGDGLDQRLPTMKGLRECDEMAVVLVTRIAALPLIVDKVLALCGFDCRDARFFLPRPPKSPEIGNESVVVVAERGGMRIDAPLKGPGLDPSDATDARVIAAQLYPRANSKLHLFARTHAEGWKALVGAENWSRE